MCEYRDYDCFSKCITHSYDYSQRATYFLPGWFCDFNCHRWNKLYMESEWNSDCGSDNKHTYCYNSWKLYCHCYKCEWMSRDKYHYNNYSKCESTTGDSADRSNYKLSRYTSNYFNKRKLYFLCMVSRFEYLYIRR